MFLAKDFLDQTVTCGETNFYFSGTFPYLVSTIITIIKIAVPILLIIFGMLDLGKAVIAAKEDEIKKGQQTFIKRAIAAVIVFFVIQVVQIVVRFVAGEDNGIADCLDCFIRGEKSDFCLEQ